MDHYDLIRFCVRYQLDLSCLRRVVPLSTQFYVSSVNIIIFSVIAPLCEYTLSDSSVNHNVRVISKTQPQSIPFSSLSSSSLSCSSSSSSSIFLLLDLCSSCESSSPSAFCLPESSSTSDSSSPPEPSSVSGSCGALLHTIQY